MSDVEDASRFISFALKPKLTPSAERSGDYSRLVGRFIAESSFARAAEDVAAGLGLWLVSVDPMVGVVACAEDESSLAMGLRD